MIAAWLEKLVNVWVTKEVAVLGLHVDRGIFMAELLPVALNALAGAMEINRDVLKTLLARLLPEPLKQPGENLLAMLIAAHKENIVIQAGLREAVILGMQEKGAVKASSPALENRNLKSSSSVILPGDKLWVQYTVHHSNVKTGQTEIRWFFSG